MSASADATPNILRPPARPPRIEVGAHTATGKRGQLNEDQYLVAKLCRGIVVADASISLRGDEDLSVADTLLIVADGMGGHAGGRIASRTVTRTVAEEVSKSLAESRTRGTPHESATTLTCALHAAHAALVRVAEREDVDHRFGSTATVAFIEWPRLTIAHVGDSRCYHLRDRRLVRLTKDHTLAEQLKDNAVNAPIRAQHILTNVVSADSRPQPDTQTLRLLPGDRLLLVTDGVTKELDDVAMRAIVANAGDPAAAARRLTTKAQEAGGRDDATAVVACAWG